MIAIEEELEEDSTPGTPFHFGTWLYLYPSTSDFFTSFDPSSFQVPIRKEQSKILVEDMDDDHGVEETPEWVPDNDW